MAKRDLFRSSVRNSVLFTRHVVPAAIKPVRTLWNEVIGFIFIVFAIIFGISAVRAGLEFKGDGSSFVRLLFPAAVAIIMAYYGVSSFRKARRISRS